MPSWNSKGIENHNGRPKGGASRINFLFDKFVGGKQLIVVAGIGWAYFIPKIKKGIQFHGFT